VLFREETEAALWTGPHSLGEEGGSTEECWMEAADADALEGDLDSFAEEKEAAEFLLKDFSTAESKEDVEEDTEEVCSAWASGVEIQEEEGVRWGEGGPSDGSLWSFPLEELCGGEQEEAAGGDGCVVGGEPGSAAGEHEGDVWDNPFFSEEWEDRDSRLPIGVVSGLLLNVSPENTKKKCHMHESASLKLWFYNRLMSCKH